MIFPSTLDWSRVVLFALKRLGHVTKRQPTNDGHLSELIGKWIAYEPIHSYYFVLIQSYTNTYRLNYFDAELKWLSIKYGRPHKHKEKVTEIEPESRCRLFKLVIILRNKVFGNLLSNTDLNPRVKSNFKFVSLSFYVNSLFIDIRFQVIPKHADCELYCTTPYR